MKTLTFSSLLLLLLLGCANTQNDTQAIDKPSDEIIDINQLPGLYLANLPCPNCGSVRVNLLLEADNRYDKTEEITSDQTIYFESGRWQVNGAQLKLLPDAAVADDNAESDAVSTIRWFRYDGQALILLDENGKTYPGNAERYRFEKK